jgi:hypothetical protein
MASQNAKRRSRKARRRATAGSSRGPGTSGRSGSGSGPSAPTTVARQSEPRAVPSQRRKERAAREAGQRRQSREASRSLGTYGDRPAGLFDPIPVSEIAIFAGIVGVVVGVIIGGGPALIVGAIVCGLGVVEVTAREHFTGYRSHATLLAAIPAVLVEVALAEFVGVPKQRILLLLPIIPIFGLGYWLLRRSFRIARHSRVTRPPSA